MPGTYNYDEYELPPALTTQRPHRTVFILPGFSLGNPTVIARRTHDHRIHIEIYPYLAAGEPDDDDDDADDDKSLSTVSSVRSSQIVLDDGEDGEEYPGNIEASEDELPRNFYGFCTAHPQSDFHLLRMREDFELSSPTLLFISPEGKMKLGRAEVDGGKESVIRTIFEPHCRQISAFSYLRRVHDICAKTAKAKSK